MEDQGSRRLNKAKDMTAKCLLVIGFWKEKKFFKGHFGDNW